MTGNHDSEKRGNSLEGYSKVAEEFQAGGGKVSLRKTATSTGNRHGATGKATRGVFTL